MCANMSVDMRMNMCGDMGAEFHPGAPRRRDVLLDGIGHSYTGHACMPYYGHGLYSYGMYSAATAEE